MTEPMNLRNPSPEERLIAAMVGSCTCGAMSPEAQFHAVSCHSAAMEEALFALKAKDDRIDALRAASPSREELIEALRPFVEAQSAWSRLAPADDIGFWKVRCTIADLAAEIPLRHWLTARSLLTPSRKEEEAT
jgi:hypothetical protein